MANPSSGPSSSRSPTGGSSTSCGRAPHPRRTASAEADAVARLGDAAALRLLETLPEDQRNVMVLRIVADLTVEQTAVVLGKRPGAVKALQRRALESMRKRISRTRTLFAPPSDSEK